MDDVYRLLHPRYRGEQWKHDECRETEPQLDSIADAYTGQSHPLRIYHGKRDANIDHPIGSRDEESLIFWIEGSHCSSLAQDGDGTKPPEFALNIWDALSCQERSRDAWPKVPA